MENKRIEFILEHELISSISKRDITEYIEQLEKENAELKEELNRWSLCNEVTSEIERETCNKLKKERRRNTKLKQQLQAKDKGLEKACGKIEYETQDNDDCPSVAYGFVPKCCNEDFCEGSNKECWKEWCENGID